MSLPQHRRTMWHKLKSSLTWTGGCGGCGSSKLEQVSTSVQSKLNVNEEYMEVFRTKSYIEIWSKVHEGQSQLRTTTTTEEETTFSSSLSSVPSPVPSYTHLCDHLLEPSQQILIEMIQSCTSHHLRRLLTDYFECSLEACKICGFLLRGVEQTRAHHCKIQKIITRDYTDDVDEDNQCGLIFHELASFANLANPLSDPTPEQFHLIHDKYELMLYRLTVTRKKIERRAKLIRFCKKAAGISLVVTCTTLAMVTLILAAHTLVGIAASPALITVWFGLLKRRIKSTRMGLNTRVLTRVGAQLDAAAKGVYILNRDFDTVNRLVMRLYDEIEHGKDIAEMCMRNQNKQLLMEVVREFKINECCFMEKVGELEEHVYLCFVTIKRARRLVLQELMVQSQGNA